MEDPRFGKRAIKKRSLQTVKGISEVCKIMYVDWDG